MILNYTKHPIHFLDGPTMMPDGVARLHEYRYVTGGIDGIEIAGRCLGPVYGLPDPAPGLWYIVPLMVALALPGRDDLLTPGRRYPDETGRIVTRNLCVIVPEKNRFDYQLKRVQ
jgi:hypothetical protein